jgi:hypothetical protein
MAILARKRPPTLLLCGFPTGIGSVVLTSSWHRTESRLSRLRSFAKEESLCLSRLPWPVFVSCFLRALFDIVCCFLFRVVCVCMFFPHFWWWDFFRKIHTLVLIQTSFIKLHIWSSLILRWTTLSRSAGRNCLWIFSCRCTCCSAVDARALTLLLVWVF